MIKSGKCSACDKTYKNIKKHLKTCVLSKYDGQLRELLKIIDDKGNERKDASLEIKQVLDIIQQMKNEPLLRKTDANKLKIAQEVMMKNLIILRRGIKN